MSTVVRVDEFLLNVMPSITSVYNELLLAPFIEFDMKDALFSMHPDKALGIDGMNPSFYQKN